VLGSLLIGFTVERSSDAEGFGLAGVMAILGLATFLVTEARSSSRCAATAGGGIILASWPATASSSGARASTI